MFFFCFLAQKTLKIYILTSVWSVQHPNTGQNIQHLFLAYNIFLPDHHWNLTHQRPRECSLCERKQPQPGSYTGCSGDPCGGRKTSLRRIPRRWAQPNRPRSSLGCRKGYKPHPVGRGCCTCWCWRGSRRCSWQPQLRLQVPENILSTMCRTMFIAEWNSLKIKFFKT